MHFGSRGPREFATEMPCPRLGRRRTGTRHGNVYRSVREKQENVVYRQRVLQTVTSLRVVSHARPPERSHTLAMEKINSRESAGWSLGLG